MTTKGKTMRELAAKIVQHAMLVNPIVWIAGAAVATVGAGVVIATQTHIVQSMVSLMTGAFW
jgi:hypothetical protein